MRRAAMFSLQVLLVAGCAAAPPTPPGESVDSPRGWTSTERDTLSTDLDALTAEAERAVAADRLSAVLDLRLRLRDRVARGTEANGPLPARLDARATEIDARLRGRAAALEAAGYAASPRPTARAPLDDRTPSPAPGPRRDALSWPLARVNVTSGFGRRLGVFEGDAHDLGFHDGVDLEAREGEAVTACGPGGVRFADFKGGYGLMVVVDHGRGVETGYAHLASAEVVVGDRVEAGRTLGRAGATGRSTAPHLHLMVSVNGRKLDPVVAIGVPLITLSRAHGMDRAAEADAP